MGVEWRDADADAGATVDASAASILLFRLLDGPNKIGIEMKTSGKTASSADGAEMQKDAENLVVVL